MTCPKCRREMQEILSEGVPIDFCTACRGSFLDKGEHVAFAGYPEAFREAIEAGPNEAKSSAFACPRCGGRMRAGWVLARDFEIDRCDGCGGVWFDSKELSRLKKLQPSAVTVVPAGAAREVTAEATVPPPSTKRAGSARTPAAPDSGGGAVCPKCEQPPRASDRWQCRCGWQWNAILSRGSCPRCRRVWRELQCLQCGQWAPPADWFA